jgi:predicted XRE-type DNA-binding protein
MDIAKKYGEMQLKSYIYHNRYKIGSNIIEFIRNNGYTKSSFSKLTGISRPTIDKLVKGEIDNNTTLKKHVDKIIATFNINLEELMDYKHLESESKCRIVASDNAPEEYKLSDSAKRMLGFLDDIIDLYEVYNEDR